MKILLFLAAFMTPWLPSAKGPNGTPGVVKSSFSDDFNRADGALGANWTVSAGTIAIVSNKASAAVTFDFTQKQAQYSGTACTTVNQYVKATFDGTGSTRSSVIVRYTNSSTAFYEIQYDLVNDLIYWNHWTAIGGTKTQIVASGAVSATFPASFGFTITGTGTGTEVRVWLNPTGAVPDSATSWGGDTTPDVTFTTDPASAVDSGAYVGIGGFSSSAVAMTYDTFSGGDIP